MHKKTVFKFDCQSADGLPSEGYNSVNTALGTDTADHMQFYTTAVRPGFCLNATTIDPMVMPSYDFEIANAPVQFSYCLTGEMRTIFHHRRKKQASTFINRRGVNTICSVSHTSGRTVKLSDRPLTTVAIQIDRKLLLAYLAPELENFPEPVRKVLMGKAHICTCPMSSAMYQASLEIFGNRYTGRAKQFFMESKALELLALQIDLLRSGKGFGRKSLFSDDDIDRIREAGDILLRNIKNPPTIAALARLSGINEFKLKKGFKQVFGTTVFGFLQTHRMAVARDLIRHNGADVTLAANSVGYVNVGHFISCYKKAFGVTPGEHKRIRA